MIRDRPAKPEESAPVREGEFRRITGIAEATEKRLIAAGITTFQQLALLSAGEIAAALPGQVGVKERALRQDWTGQAQQLAAQLAVVAPAVVAPAVSAPAAETPAADPPQAERLAEPDERQHYESFLVELLLDDERRARRTRITHVRGGEKDSWAGWDAQRAGSWIEHSARLAATAAGEAPGAADEPGATRQQPPRTAAAIQAALPPAQRIEDAACAALDPLDGQPLAALQPGVPFRLRFTARTVSERAGQAWQYRLDCLARDMISGVRKTIAQAEGETAGGSEILLEALSPGLPPGIFLLEAAVTLIPLGSRPREPLHAISEGLLLEALEREPAGIA